MDTHCLIYFSGKVRQLDGELKPGQVRGGQVGQGEGDRDDDGGQEPGHSGGGEGESNGGGGEKVSNNTLQ